jgi:hypothetical protein
MSMQILCYINISFMFVVVFACPLREDIHMDAGFRENVYISVADTFRCCSPTVACLEQYYFLINF